MVNDDAMGRYHGQCAGDTKRVLQSIIVYAEHIVIEVARGCPKDKRHQGSDVLLDEKGLFAEEEIAWIDLPLRQPFPEHCSRDTRHSTSYRSITANKARHLSANCCASRARAASRAATSSRTLSVVDLETRYTAELESSCSRRGR